MKKFTITLAPSILAVLFAATPCNAKGKAKHVVLIGLDGWGAYSVPKADIPAIKQLMADGAYTLEKRSTLPSSSAIRYLGFHVYGCRSRIARIYAMGFQNT